jgi:hypothetical protein
VGRYAGILGLNETAATADAGHLEVGRTSGVLAVWAVVATLLLLALASSANAAPGITGSAVSQVTATEAIFKALVNPEGEATTYHFEYGLDDCSLSTCQRTPLK